MLHHVEGVIWEVDLLDAVDDFLLRLGVDGLLPQLPQLLLQYGETGGERKRQTKRDRVRRCPWYKVLERKGTRYYIKTHKTINKI